CSGGGGGRVAHSRGPAVGEPFRALALGLAVGAGGPRGGRVRSSGDPRQPPLVGCLPAAARRMSMTGDVRRFDAARWGWISTAIHAFLTLVSIGAFAVMIGRPIPTTA